MIARWQILAYTSILLAVMTGTLLIALAVAAYVLIGDGPMCFEGKYTITSHHNGRYKLLHVSNPDEIILYDSVKQVQLLGNVQSYKWVDGNLMVYGSQNVVIITDDGLVIMENDTEQ